MTTRRQFLKAIAAEPHDAALRLVFADWLEETGHPRQANGQRRLATILKSPYDTRAHFYYAAWLDATRRKKEARLHRWIVLLLTGNIVPDMLIGRQGVLRVDWGHGEFRTLPPLSGESREEMEQRAQELFAAHPDVYLVVVGRTGPRGNGLDEDNRPAGAPGEVRSPVLYLWAGPDSVHRIATAPEFEVGSLCPFCGWDVQRGETCEHLVFHLDEWGDNLGGISQGAFWETADASLGKLQDALKAFVQSCGANEKRLDSLTPNRLRRLAQALVQTVGLCDDPEEIEGWNEEAYVPRSDFQSYLADLFGLVEKKGSVTTWDTGDRWGTCADLFWAPNAKATVQQIVRQVSEDASTLRLATK
jgi:uncharacterized protein (TIGR02996 family)